jgi:hypothetical protein
MSHATQIMVGPHFERPPFPVFLEGETFKLGDNEKVARSFRQIYDWKAYNTSGLGKMEAYWDLFVAHSLSPMLPVAIRSQPMKHYGINLGTFNGAYQKAWMRNGYRMFGVEIANVIDELLEYGCEGVMSSIFEMPMIQDATFDFAVLDRTICTKGFYEAYDRSHEQDIKPMKHTVAGLMREVFRIIKKDGVLIGILYNYYTGAVVRELAKYGTLKIWPTYTGLLGFSVVKDGNQTLIPEPTNMRPEESSLFRRFYPTVEGMAALYLPTNEIVVWQKNESYRSFAPRSEHWSVLSK